MNDAVQYDPRQDCEVDEQIDEELVDAVNEDRLLLLDDTQVMFQNTSLVKDGRMQAMLPSSFTSPSSQPF